LEAKQPPLPASGEGSKPGILRLSDAGDAKPAWVTLLTTEHYNLQMQRASTISETNGRASIFLGAVSAGLIALGFQSAEADGSGGTTVFAVLVLSTLAFLGVTTFLRCLEASIDDWQFLQRINRLRAVYAQLVPELADLLLVAAGAEQSHAMLAPRRQPFQMMLTVAGTLAVITSVLVGAAAGVLVYGLAGRLWVGVAVGAVVGTAVVITTLWFQRARWADATTTAAATA
jgi:hypothetical protein